MADERSKLLCQENPGNRLMVHESDIPFPTLCFYYPQIVTSNVNGIKIARFWNPEKFQLVLRRGISAVPGYCQLSSLALVCISR